MKMISSLITEYVYILILTCKVCTHKNDCWILKRLQGHIFDFTLESSELQFWSCLTLRRNLKTVCLLRVRRGLYSPWCHLRKPLGLGKLSKWMECFFRHPICTFFQRRTSLCLFLFQIHSIIPDCPIHSRALQELHVPIFHHQPGPIQPPKLTSAPTPSKRPHHSTPPPNHSSSRMCAGQEKTLFLFYSPGIWVSSDEGSPHSSETPGGYILQLFEKWGEGDTILQLHMKLH